MSSEISWSVAQTMIRAYWDNQNALTIPTTSGVQTLKGYRISKANIESIINQSNVTDVFIAFGVRQQDVGQATQYFTTILAGINSSNNLVTTKVYDFCEPCPDQCPSNLTSVVNGE